jgi:hypothetical protein
VNTLTKVIDVKHDPAEEHSLTEWLGVFEVVDRWRRDGRLSREELMDVQLAPDEVIVVIGARVSNVGEALWNNPRCAYLDGADAVKRGLPQRTRAVVFTRYVGHVDFKSILNEARQRKLAMFPIQGTGQLKLTLNALLTNAMPTVTADPPVSHEKRVLPEFSPVVPEEPEPPAPEAPEPAKVFQRGDVTAWVREHFTPGLKFADIVRLAAQQKVPYKDSSISAAFYAIRRERELAVPKPTAPPKWKPTAGPPPAPPPAPPPPPVELQMQPDGNLVLEPAAQPGDELVRLVDEVMAGLHLVREAALKMAEDRHKMEQILELAQQLTGKTVRKT